MVRPNDQPEGEAHTHSESHRLRELLASTVSAHHLYLEDVQVRQGGKNPSVHVVVDLPEDATGGVSLDALSEVSSSLSQVLDDDPHDPGRPYTLEVSSPGADRPLTEPRHWRRAKGRLVHLELHDQESLTGRLLDVDADGVRVRPQTTVKKGMKPRKGEPVHIPFTQIGKGAVEIEFNAADEPELDGEVNAGDHTSSEEA